MSTTRNLLFSAVHFLIVVALIAFGGIFIALSCNVQLRIMLVEKLSYASEFFLYIGLVILGVSALLLYGFYHLNKGQFFQISMGPARVVKVDVAVIAALARTCFSTLFPGTEAPIDIVIHPKNKIEVITSFPNPSEFPLQQIEEELSAAFAKSLNYRHSFILTIQQSKVG